MSPPLWNRLACDICGGYLNLGTKRTIDCGGTCLHCMAVIGEDPDAIRMLKESNDPADRAAVENVPWIKHAESSQT